MNPVPDTFVATIVSVNTIVEKFLPPQREISNGFHITPVVQPYGEVKQKKPNKDEVVYRQ